MIDGARLAPTAQREQRRPDPAGGPGTRFRADRPPGGGVQLAGPLLQALLEHGHGRPDRRPSAGRTPGPHPTAPPAGIRRRRPRSAPLRPAAAAQSARPPSSSISPRPPSVQAEPPNPTTMRVAPRVQRRGDELANAAAVRRQRGLRCRRAAEQRPVRRPARIPGTRSATQRPAPTRRARRRPAGRGPALPAFAQPAGQHVDKARSAVGLRRDDDRGHRADRCASPSAMAAAASTAVRLSPKLSGAMSNEGGARVPTTHPSNIGRPADRPFSRRSVAK